MGCPAGAGAAAGVSKRADGKDVGETGRPHGAEERVDVGESVLYLFYLCLVLLAHQMARGRVSGRWWVEHNEADRSGRDCPSAPVFLLFFAPDLFTSSEK